MGVFNKNFHILNAFNFLCEHSVSAGASNANKLHICIGHGAQWNSYDSDEYGTDRSDLNPPIPSAFSKLSIKDIIAIRPVMRAFLVYRVSNELDIPVTGLYISETSLRVPVHSYFTISAVVLPTNAYNRDVQWLSTAQSVVGNSTSGRFYAKKVGDTELYCHTVGKDIDGNDIVVKCSVIVYDPDEDILVTSSVANASDANESDANESDANESDANESDANESDANESDANESDANIDDSDNSEEVVVNEDDIDDSSVAVSEPVACGYTPGDGTDPLPVEDYVTYAGQLYKIVQFGNSFPSDIFTFLNSADSKTLNPFLYDHEGNLVGFPHYVYLDVSFSYKELYELLENMDLDSDHVYSEDDVSSLNNLDYRSTALLKGTTYSLSRTPDVYKGGNGSFSSDITSLGDLLYLDYFHPIYRDSSKVEKIAFLIEF